MFNKINEKTKVEYSEMSLPKIFISKKATNKMLIYIDECSKEVGWLGTVEQHKDIYLIDDVMLFEQEVSSVTTDIDEGDLSKFASNKMEELGAEEGSNLLNSVKMWGHSHVNMGVTPSSTDDKSMEMFGESGHDFFIRLIANKKGVMKIDLFDYERGIVFYNLDFSEVATQEERELEKQIQELQEKLEQIAIKDIEELEVGIKEEIKAKVKEKTYTKKKDKKDNISKLNDYAAYFGGYNGYYVEDGAYGYTDYSEYQEDDKVVQKSLFSNQEFNLLGTKVPEKVLYEIAYAIDEEDCRAILIEYGVYKSQSKQVMFEMMERADELITLELGKGGML